MISINEKYLEWDSNFFNLKICRVNNNYSEFDWNLVSKELKEKLYDLAYVFSEYPISNKAEIIYCKSFDLVDVKIVYEITITNEMPVDIMCVEFNSSVHNIYEVYDLAIQSGEYSRFRIDKGFDENKFYQLYKEWVDKSIDLSIADGLIIAQIEGQIVGFVTYKAENERIVIGLIAVSGAFRGRKIGTYLVNEVINRALALKINKLQVATQLDNLLACKFYEKLNMKINSKTNIYHLWL